MRLECEVISAAAFAPFGILVDPQGRIPETINAGTTARHSDLAALDLRGGHADPVLGIYVARARRFPLALEKLERHAEAAQVFIPLGMHRFVVVVAPGRDAPDWDGVKAFLTKAGQGIALHRGTWHHGLVALHDGDRFAVIEGGGYRADTREITAPRALELAEPAAITSARS